MKSILSLMLWFEYSHCAKWSDTLKMEANVHLKRNTYTDTYKQEQNLSRKTPTTILILISFCPLENKFYISYLLCSWKKLIKFVPLCFLRTLGNFAANLRTEFVPCFSCHSHSHSHSAFAMFILYLWTELDGKHFWNHYDYGYDYDNDKKQDTKSVL